MVIRPHTYTHTSSINKYTHSSWQQFPNAISVQQTCMPLRRRWVAHQTGVSLGFETQKAVCCRITFSVKSIVIIRADLIGSFRCLTFHAWTFLQSFYWQLLGQGKFFDFSAGLLSYFGPAFRKKWLVTVTAATLEVYVKSQKLQNQTIHETISM